ncbi:MAG: hypothetical protein IH877_08095, partial [Gemmatimonadetes bacterium]|nr:hypothetical protein [Gemmatimonadota bacterium]
MFQNGTSRSPHLPGRALRGLAAGTVLAVVGCGESSTGPAQPGAMTELPDISAAIVAANTEEADNFHFLPPIAPEQEFSGTFDAGLDPVVEICQLDDDPTCELPVTSGTADLETVRVAQDDDEAHYVVHWRTRGVDLGGYRISVSVDGSELGHTDVTVV